MTRSAHVALLCCLRHDRSNQLMTSPSTLFKKIWDDHVVVEEPNSPAVLYIDLHLVHEVTSPQAFTGLRARGLKVRRPDRTVGTVDHSIPTIALDGDQFSRLNFADEMGRKQIETLRAELRRLRHSSLRSGQPASGHRPRHRAGAGRHAARHDHRLRRQPHGHARRVRRAGLRHRHQRSGTRPRHAMPLAARTENV